MEYDMPKGKSSIIKVIGIGGGGSNAVTYMYEKGITDVDFVVCNTDQQALDTSPVPNKIALGPSLTEGRGAGANPEIGRQATEESEEDIRSALSVNTKMVFITAGMGGGTGTGGAPVVARIAREMDILTVAIVSTPFPFEGRKKKANAMEGIAALREYVDSIIVISNEKMMERFRSHSITEAFNKLNNILAIGAKGIAEIITMSGEINVDFEDVKAVMKDSGVAIMGYAQAEGEHRAIKAAEEALSSPLLDDNNIMGSKNLLLNISFGEVMPTVEEIDEITLYMNNETGDQTDMIWGTCYNESLGEKICITVVATGFEINQAEGRIDRERMKPVKRSLGDEQPEAISSEAEEPEKKEWVLDTSNESPEDKRPSQMPIDFNLPPIPLVKQVKPVNNDLEKAKDHTPVDEPIASNENTESKTPKTPKANNSNGINDQLRIDKLKTLSNYRLTDAKLEEMERTPAIERQGTKLFDPPHSSEREVSRHTLTEKVDEEDGSKKIEINKNNKFLHDNVD